MTNYPKGTTHVYTDTYSTGAIEYYKEVGVSAHGNPTYVRWIKTRNAWAVTPKAFSCVDEYATKL